MQPNETELNSKIEIWQQNSTLQKAMINGKEKNCEADIYIKTWTPLQRKLRALKTFIICIILAAISLFIPIAHFFLVPLFLITAFILPAASYSKKSIILGGRGTCPYCGKLFEVAQSADRWPISDICSDCSRHVTVTKV